MSRVLLSEAEEALRTNVATGIWSVSPKSAWETLVYFVTLPCTTHFARQRRTNIVKFCTVLKIAMIFDENRQFRELVGGGGGGGYSL